MAPKKTQDKKPEGENQKVKPKAKVAENPAKQPSKQTEQAKAPKEKKEEAPKPAPKEAKAKVAKSSAAGVFIRNLDFPGMNIDTIKEAFSAYPKIAEVRLRHGKYVLIFFEALQTAQKLAADLNGKQVKGNKVNVELVKRAKPTPNREDYCTTVFVGNLGGKTTKSQLFKHFASCGKIVKVRVYNSSKHGFIYFDSNASARKAVAMGDIPFSYGKDCVKENPPQQARFKLDIRYSIRTVEFDKKRSEKRYHRAPLSMIRDRVKKNADRAKKRAAIKKQKEKKKESSSKKSSEQKPAKEANPAKPAEVKSPKSVPAKQPAKQPKAKAAKAKAAKV